MVAGLITRARSKLALEARNNPPGGDAPSPLELPSDLAAGSKDWAAQARRKLVSIEKFVAKGGGGNVYAGKVDGIEQPVAIKILRGDPRSGKTGEQQAAEFKAESARFDALAKACADLGVAVPEMHGLVDTGGNPAYAMTLVEGIKPADALAKGLLTEKGLAKLKDVVERMIKRGDYFEDVGANFLILSEAQTIRGKRYEPGDLVFVDPAGFSSTLDLVARNRAGIKEHGFKEREFADRDLDRLKLASDADGNPILDAAGKPRRETWEDLWKAKAERAMRESLDDALGRLKPIPSPGAKPAASDPFEPKLMQVLRVLHGKRMTVGQKRDWLLGGRKAEQAPEKLGAHEVEAIKRGQPGSHNAMRTYKFARAGDEVLVTVIELPVGQLPRLPGDGVPRQYRFTAEQAPVRLAPGETLEHVLAYER